MGRGLMGRGLSGRSTARGAVAVIIALLVAVPGLAAPVTAQAASGQSTLPSLGSTPPVPTTTAPTQTGVTNTTTSSAGGGGGLSSGTALGIAIAAFLIIIGIGFAIFRDARRRVPERRARTEERIPGSKRPGKARKLSTAEKRRRKRGQAPRRR